MSGTGLTSLFSDAAREKFAKVSLVKVPAPKTSVKRKLEEENEGQVEADGAAVAADSQVDEGEPIESSEAPSKVNKSHQDDIVRTLFVGNIPMTCTEKTMRSLFEEYGTIESIRFRSIPITGMKVAEAGNQALVKKLCVQKKKIGQQKGSQNAYIVYTTPLEGVDPLTMAIQARNNHLLEGRHLRVDRAHPSTAFENKRTLFLGGLPYYVDEEELRSFFAEHLPNGQADIEGIRLVRDQESLVGKGIGYLLCANRAAMYQGLSLHQKVFKKRWTIRVTPCGKNSNNKSAGNNNQQQQQQQQQGQQQQQQQQTNHSSSTSSSGSGNDGQPKRVKKPRHIPRPGSLANNSSNPATATASPSSSSSPATISAPATAAPVPTGPIGPLGCKTNNPNVTAAMKRINLKGVMTKKKLLAARKQTKQHKPNNKHRK